jgi:predicted PurR-regulated permease PerM
LFGQPLRDFAFMFALLAAVMELLPQIGPILSMIPPLLLALTISPIAFLVTGAFYLVIFTIEANFLVPSIEGDVVSFSRPAVLFLIAMGLAIGGIVGAILALPVAAIARDLFSYLFHHAEHEALLLEEPGGT